ncbi:sigma-70 family RNA polymerase sigma factor [Fodinicola acaciae]|uniref:sigma-70 family RNA polymerase sigma factor n=1 Tax=Fodinicola acaciae TaxID=2681555 RepID=UPI001C9E4398|nr:sigma-70 family RNA polymerase sigma factor [Fodinicola acaciae]
MNSGRAAVEELYRVAYQRLVRSVYGLTGHLGEAQDIVHDAFTIAMSRPHKVRDADDPEAWLRTVALNLARRRFRRRVWMDRFLRKERPPEAVAAPGLDRIAVLAAMKQLPPASRETLGMFYLADLSVEDISKTLGIPTGTVKARLSRGRAALAEILGETDE